jgi:hypothetical protein
VERGVFPRPEIEARLSKFVLVRLWINDRKPEARSAEWARMLQERFGTSAIPFYAALSNGDQVLGTIDFPGGTVDGFAGRFGPWLDGMLEKAGAK